MHTPFKKAIEICKKTGDRLIIFDGLNNSDGYVIMGLNQYEKLLSVESEVRGLTEEELLDKINRDIAIWRSEQEFFQDELRTGDSFLHKEVERYEPKKFQVKAPEIRETQPVEIPSRSLQKELPQQEEPKKIKRWSIPEDRKKKAEEIVKGEEHYIEDITF